MNDAVLRLVLREHWLAGVECDHDAKTDRASCACSMVDLGWQPSIGSAVNSWIDHLFSIVDEPSNRRSTDSKEGIGVGMPAEILLNQFGSLVWDAFGEVPYLVGSAARSKNWRDVDVRLILDDAEYERLIGKVEKPHCTNPRWNAFCLAFAALGQRMTGLPIDFQIDQQTEANELHRGERHPLILSRLAEQNRGRS